MDQRLDPRCNGARALHKTHQDQEALLVAGTQGQLTTVIRTTQEKQVKEHLIRCTTCRHYEPRCTECGYDPRHQRHGWMCTKQTHRWRDLLPWNWRAKKAARIPAGAQWRHVTNDPPSRIPGGSQADPGWIPGGSRVEPTRDPGGTAAAASRSAYSPPVAERSASGAPKPRPKPQPLKPSALGLAYAALGLSPDASEDAVRSAYRSRAQQYHPDKVAHMAPEFRAVADQKMTEINGAYERIKRSWPSPAK